jgi:hypothetical protein
MGKIRGCVGKKGRDGVEQFQRGIVTMERLMGAVKNPDSVYFTDLRL